MRSDARRRARRRVAKGLERGGHPHRTGGSPGPARRRVTVPGPESAFRIRVRLAATGAPRSDGGRTPTRSGEGAGVQRGRGGSGSGPAGTRGSHRVSGGCQWSGPTVCLPRRCRAGDLSTAAPSESESSWGQGPPAGPPRRGPRVRVKLGPRLAGGAPGPTARGGGPEVDYTQCVSSCGSGARRPPARSAAPWAAVTPGPGRAGPLQVLPGVFRAFLPVWQPEKRHRKPPELARPRLGPACRSPYFQLISESLGPGIRPGAD